MVYAASDAYHKGIFEAAAARPRPIVCSLRCSDRQPTRCRVVGWVATLVKAMGLPVAKSAGNSLSPGSLVGEVKRPVRKAREAGGCFHDVHRTRPTSRRI